MAADELKGVRVLAMNVKRLGHDNANPTAYRARWPAGRSSSPARRARIQGGPRAEKLSDLLDEG